MLEPFLSPLCVCLFLKLKNKNKNKNKIKKSMVIEVFANFDRYSIAKLIKIV